MPARLLGKGWLRKRHFNPNMYRPGPNAALRRFSITEAALLLIAAYLASRGLGVLRQSLFNALFGTGPAAVAYYAAFRLPDTLFNLIAGGALTHAFIPVFISQEKDRGQREAWRLASLVFNILLVALTIFVLIGEFLAPAFVNNILVPGYSPSQQALVTTLTRIMLIQPLLLGLGTVATAVLSSKRQFLMPSISIVVYNFGLIGGLLCTLAVPSLGIYGPTFGVLAAGLFQASVQIPAVFREGVRYIFTWNLKNPALYNVLRLLIPNVIAVAIASTAVTYETNFTSYLSDKASLAALHNAYLLYDLPVALLIQAVAIAALPRMAELAAQHSFFRLRLTIIRVVGSSLLLSVLCAFLLYFFAKPIIELLFHHGAFTRHASNLTNVALIGYLVALPCVTASQLLAKGFYALKDAVTPLITSVLSVALRYVLLIFLLKSLTGPHALIAIPLALAGSAALEALLLTVLLFTRLHKRMALDAGLQRFLRRRAGGAARDNTTTSPFVASTVAGDAEPTQLLLSDSLLAPTIPAIAEQRQSHETLASVSEEMDAAGVFPVDEGIEAQASVQIDAIPISQVDEGIEAQATAEDTTLSPQRRRSNHSC